MSAVATSRSKGMKLGAEPRKLIILGVLLAVAVIILFFNSDSGTSDPATSARPTVSSPAAPGAPPRHARRRTTQRSNDRSVFRMQEVTSEAERGNIDPTLRLDLLARLKTVEPKANHRSLFEAGPAAPAGGQAAAAPIKPVQVVPGPLPHNQSPVTVQPVNPAPPPIPLKFYGFAAPATSNGPRRGFFLDGDNIIIGNEGEILKGHYRIVSLQPRSAEMEDLTTKNRQSLPIIPEMRQGEF